MGPVLIRAATDLRARWRGWLALAIVLGVIAGAITAAAAGARRTDSAYPRFTRASHAADELVYNTPSPDQIPIDINQVMHLPQVAQAGLVRYFAIDSPDTAAYASVDGRAFANRGINRLKIIRGRAARPDRPDEAVADFVLADAHHLRVGQKYEVRFFAADDTDLEHPVAVSFRLVGVAAVPGQFPPQTAKGYLGDPPVYLTPAFYARQGRGFLSLGIAAVRLRPGTATAFGRAVAAMSAKETPSITLADQAEVVRRAIHLQAIALWLLAGLLGIFGLLLGSQLLARQASLQSSENATLRAIGMTRRQLLAVAGLRAAAAGVIAAVVAVGTAVTLSPFTPIGAARLAEPHPGPFVDLAALGLVALGLVVGAVLVTAWPAWRAASQGADQVGGDARLRPALLPSALIRAALPPTITSGARLALETGRGRSAVPVRSSVTSAALGLVALATAITFGANLTHLLATPRQYGVTWDAEILHNDGPFAVTPALAIAGRDPDVASVAWETGAPVLVGRLEADAHVFEPSKGEISSPLLNGRQPRTADEIALGGATMRKLHVRIGDRVPVRAWSDAGVSHSMRIVGQMVLSPGAGGFTTATNLGEGSAMTEAGMRAATPPGAPIPHPYVVAVRFKSGVDPVRAGATLWRRLGGPPPATGYVVQTPATPVALVDFGHVRRLPLILGGLLALMAALTIAHVLVSGIRRRRVDLAILKTLGFTSRQVRVTVAWQATVLAALAVAIGLPLGVASAHLVWDRFARQIGVLSDLKIPWLPLLLVVPGAVVVANLVALIPGTLAGRVAPALALRSE